MKLIFVYHSRYNNFDTFPLHAEPVSVFGGATLAISDVKVMEVTEDYLGLDERPN